MQGRISCALSALNVFLMACLEDSSDGCRKAALHGVIGGVATGKLAGVGRVDLVDGVDGVDLVDAVVVIGFAA